MSTAAPVIEVHSLSLAACNWEAALADLDRQGHLLTSTPILDPEECRRLRGGRRSAFLSVAPWSSRPAIDR